MTQRVLTDSRCVSYFTEILSLMALNWSGEITPRVPTSSRVWYGLLSTMRSAVSSSILGNVCNCALVALLMFTGGSEEFSPSFTPSAAALVCFTASFVSFFSSTAATLAPSLICCVAWAASCFVFSVSCLAQPGSSRLRAHSAARKISLIHTPTKQEPGRSAGSIPIHRLDSSPSFCCKAMTERRRSTSEPGLLKESSPYKSPLGKLECKRPKRVASDIFRAEGNQNSPAERCADAQRML